ncbi:MAG: NADP-dependent oxidoreductase [Bacteroidota bacterium]
MDEQNIQVLLAQRPQGMVKDEDFNYQESSRPQLQAGEVLVRNKFISLDPAMRGWMNAGTTYIPGVAIGAVMRALSAGEVVESMHPDFEVGSHVGGMFGAQLYATAKAEALQKLDLDKGPLSWHLGILGMPGMTAYFGLLDKGKPEAGENVFITGAAGIIGSTVGQIAKIKGCKVYGTAGTDEKCRYLLDECGFDGVINYKKEDVQTRLKELIPDKIHLFYDNVGGQIMDMALGHLARGARMVICGAISQYNASDMYGPKNYMKIVTARGYITGIIVFDYIERYPEAVAQLSEWLKVGKMKTREHIFEGIRNFGPVLKKLYTGENFGKLLLKV